MYGKLHERKLNQQDYVLSCQAVREYLADYINDEAKRVNEDSAKKRAVLQHMDYEGFRQMVLGANLFSIKTKELMKFSEGKDEYRPERILNAALLSFNKEPKQSITLIQESSTQYCKNYTYFSKNFDKLYKKYLYYDDVQQCYRLLKCQNKDRLLKIFTAEFDPSYILKIINIFDFVLIKHVQVNQDTNYLIFIVRFLEEIVYLAAVRNLILPLLVKSQKTKIKEFIDKLYEYCKKYPDNDNLAENTFQKLRNGFCF